MKELVARSGVPRTTIHYYLREGLLPPPEKTATNTGQYSEDHLERLLLIHRMRSEEEGSFPIYLIRRVLEFVDQGVDPEVALSLERAVLGGLHTFKDVGPFTIEQVSDITRIPEPTLEKYVDLGLLLPMPEESPARFDQLDLTMARAYHDVMRQMGWVEEDFRPISQQIRRISDYEWTLRNRAIRGVEKKQTVRMRARMQQFVNFLHRYLFFRARVHNIDREIKEGTSEGGGQS